MKIVEVDVQRRVPPSEEVGLACAAVGGWVGAGRNAQHRDWIGWDGTGRNGMGLDLDGIESDRVLVGLHRVGTDRAE